MAFVHPLLGALAIVFGVVTLSRGLTARNGGRSATAARRWHKRYAPWAFAAMALAGLTGLASTLVLRPDLTLGETAHLAVGLLTIGLMGSAGLLTRAFTREPRLRQLHPWLGVAAIVLAIVQGILGIELLP